MTPEQLAAIKERNEAATHGMPSLLDVYRSQMDVPALVAEVERLRGVAEAARKYRQYLPGSDGHPLGKAAHHSAHYMAAVDLIAAIDAAEGGE